jgi:hypothetical protein
MSDSKAVVQALDTIVEDNRQAIPEALLPKKDDDFNREFEESLQFILDNFPVGNKDAFVEEFTRLYRGDNKCGFTWTLTKQQDKEANTFGSIPKPFSSDRAPATTSE